VRDAISRISHLGLVETRNGVGTVVINLSDERIRHLYEMRMELASLIGILSPAGIDEDHCIQARSIHEQALKLQIHADSQEFVKLNQRLQLLISSLIGNSLLREFWNQAYFQASSVWHRMEKSIGSQVYSGLVDETSALVTALERNDISAIGYIQRIHIGYGYQLIQNHILSQDREISD